MQARCGAWHLSNDLEPARPLNVRRLDDDAMAHVHLSFLEPDGFAQESAT
jgi:hypothetical protein